MTSKPYLMQRMAITLTIIFVTGAFALGSVSALHVLKKMLFSEQMNVEQQEWLFYRITLACFFMSVLLAALLGGWLARRVMASAVPRVEQPLRQEQVFALDVSHELRTPLLVIAGACEWLSENASLDKRARRQVTRIAKAGSDMSALVDTFLQPPRQQSAHAPAAQASVYQIAAELVLQWRELIENKGLTLMLSQPISQADAPLYNAVFLRTVMGNLLRNAWHHTEQGRISLHLLPDRFCVADTGAGISESEPFIRGNYAHDDGLGVSLAQRICAEEGWHMRVQSVQPQGCCFWVQLAAE